MVIETVGEVLPGLVCLVASLVYLGLVDQVTLLVCIPYLMATGVGVIFAKKKSKPFYKIRKGISTNMVRYFVRDILERTLIQLSRKVSFETDRIRKGGVEHTIATQNIEIYNAFSWWISRISIDIFRISAIAYIAFQVVSGSMGAGSIVIIGMVFATLNRYYDKLIQSFQFFQDEYVHLSEFWEYLDDLIPFQGLQSGTVFLPTQKGIDLAKISFSYPNGNKVFHDFDLMIQPGQITAIVGRSGGGKSTLMKLLLGILRPTE